MEKGPGVHDALPFRLQYSAAGAQLWLLLHILIHDLPTSTGHLMCLGLIVPLPVAITPCLIFFSFIPVLPFILQLFFLVVECYLEC